MDIWIRLRLKMHRLGAYNLTIFVMGILIGIIGGLGSVIFRYLISLNEKVFYSINIYGLESIISPAIGGLIVGYLVYRLAEEARGHGVPEVMFSVKYRFGILRRRVALIKILASSITIGSGGSAGREGPICQIGASLASSIGQYLRLKPRDMRLLVVSGVVAGISGTFNAPLGALIFGLELFMETIDIGQLVVLIISSVVGKIVASYFLGDYPAFTIPGDIVVPSTNELILLLPLGLILGLIGSIWVILFYKFEDLFDSLNTPNIIKPSIGMLIVGIMAYIYPGLGISGVGYEVIDKYLLGGSLTINDLIIVVLLKPLATMLTIGSGGSGGIFSPSLVIGASFGALYGEVVKDLFPTFVSDPRIYSLIGMAVMFTAVAKAPLTTLIMIPEMTRMYSLFLPIMVSNSIGYLVSLIILGRDSIYLIKVNRVRYRR